MPPQKERADGARERLGPSGRSGGTIGDSPDTPEALERQELLERAELLREMLTWQLDLDDARELVREFVRDAEAFKRRLGR